MTLEQFNKASFSKDTIVVIDGEEHFFTDVDFENHEIYVIGKGWIDCNRFEIKQPYIELFGEATDMNPNFSL